jgi:hypothetical protein
MTRRHFVATCTFGAAHAAAPPTRTEPVGWVRTITRMAFGTPGEVEKLADMGVEVLHTNLVWPYFPLRRDRGGLSVTDQEALNRLVRACHSRGMKLSLGLPPFMPVALVKQHPEWREHHDDTGHILKVVPNETDLGTRSGCNLGPWGNYLIDVCCELAGDYGIDVYSFDGNYHPRICYCPACKRAYRKERDQELPPRVDLKEIPYREYLVWRGTKLVAHYESLKRRLREVRPQAAILSWTVNAGRFGHFLHSPRAMPIEVNRVFDLPMQEWWLDESNLGASIMPAFGAAYLRAVANDGPCACEPYLISRATPHATDSFPYQERLARAMLALTHGSIAAHSIGWAGHAESTRDIFAEVRQRSRWLSRTSRLPWAGLLVSEQTRQFASFSDIRERFLPPVLGTFRAMLEEHLPVNLLTDLELTEDSLARYRVLILPDCIALSDAQVRSVRRFVEAGGGLVASGESSLADELGRARKDFALADLFGTSHQGRQVGTARLSLTKDLPFTDGRLNRLVPGTGVTFRGPILSIREPTSAKVAWRRTVEGGKSQPGALFRNVGKGRVVYLASALDAALWSHSYPYQRLLLTGAIAWAAASPPPVRVKAPMCVQMSCYSRKQGKTTETIVHLFNNVVTTAHHGQPSAEVPLREEIVPIHQLRIVFTGSLPRRVFSQPENKELPMRRTGETVTVVVPKLELHSMVVATR